MGVGGAGGGGEGEGVSSQLAATACGICGFDALQAQPHVNDIRRSLLVRGCLA